MKTQLVFSGAFLLVLSEYDFHMVDEMSAEHLE